MTDAAAASTTWPSTLGRVARAEALGLVLLYGLAVSMRWTLQYSPPYGDEGLYYWLAKRPFTVPSNIHDIYGVPWTNFRAFFLERPAFMLTLSPGAVVSWEGFRTWHMLLASLLPSAGVLLLRSHGVRRPFAYGAGLLLATSLLLITWASIVYMDSLLSLFLFVALAGRLAGHAPTTFVALLASCWTKETGLVATAFLLAPLLWAGLRTGGVKLWPLRMDALSSAHFYALAAGALALPVAMVLGAPFPGTSRPGFWREVADGQLVSTWALPVLLVGLRWRRSRLLCGIALAIAGFFVATHVLMGRAVETWYVVVPVALSILAVACTLDDAWTRWRIVPARVAVVATAALFLGLAAFAGLAPNTEAKGWILHPLSGLRDNTWEGARAFELHRDPDLWGAVDALRQRPHDDIFVADVYAPIVIYPISHFAGDVWTAGSDTPAAINLTTEAWEKAIEGHQTSLLHKHDNWFSRSVRDKYAYCTVFENPNFVILDGLTCAAGASSSPTAP